MTESVLQQYLLHEYPQKIAWCEWKYLRILRTAEHIVMR